MRMLNTLTTDPPSAYVKWLMSPSAPELEEFVHHLAWHARAACRGLPPALFFPAENGSYEKGKAICARCPVRKECLDFALTPPLEHHGIWGGTSERERRRMRRRAA